MNKNRRIGEVYGDLEIIENLGNGKYKCKCVCGHVKSYFIGNMKKGKSTSCGCKRNLKVSNKLKVHGDRQTRLYRIWTNIKTRCNNPKSPNFIHYGAKGITLCEQWNDYEVFKRWSLENGYKEDLTIDRIDNGKGYFPDNCRWTNMKTQSRNREYAWFITISGITKHAKDWCEQYGINYKTAHARVSRGWSEKDAVTIPIKVADTQ